MISFIPPARILLISAIFFVLIGENVSSENPTGLRGTVSDRNNHVAVADAYVLAHRDGASDVHVLTDKNGRYAIALPIGIYDLFVSAKYYSPLCRKLQVEPDGMMIFDAPLELSSVGMQVD